MRRTIARPADRSEWLVARLDYFNASDAAALFGENEFSSLADIATRKLTRDTSEQAGPAARRGNHLEAAVASWWEDEHGLALYEPQELYVCGDVMATLDRRVVGVEDEAVEIKTTARRILDPLPSWWWQTQAQMLTTGFARIHLVVLDSTMDLQTFVIVADLDAQAELAERATKFMDCLRRGDLPPDVELGYEHRQRLNPIDDGSSVEIGDDGRALVVRLTAARKLRKAADEEEERTKAALGALLGGATTATHHGTAVLTWKTQTRSSIDVTALRQERPDVASEFSRQSTSRTMRVLQ